MGEIDNQMKSVSFTRMEDGTAEEKFTNMTVQSLKIYSGAMDAAN